MHVGAERSQQPTSRGRTCRQIHRFTISDQYKCTSVGFQPDIQCKTLSPTDILRAIYICISLTAFQPFSIFSHSAAPHCMPLYTPFYHLLIYSLLPPSYIQTGSIQRDLADYRSDEDKLADPWCRQNDIYATYQTHLMAYPKFFLNHTTLVH
jgi:hypothetical protein